MQSQVSPLKIFFRLCCIILNTQVEGLRDEGVIHSSTEPGMDETRSHDDR